MHAFIGLGIPDGVKERVCAVQKKLPKTGVRLVRPSNMHITLNFLGDIPEGVLKHVAQKLSEVSFRPFSLELTHLGTFPLSGPIHVIWVGGESDAFQKLAAQIEQRLAGFFLQENAVLHLTIARVESPADPQELHDFISAHKNVLIGAIPVDAFGLKQSVLTRQGAIYTDLATYRSDIHSR